MGSVDIDGDDKEEEDDPNDSSPNPNCSSVLEVLILGEGLVIAFPVVLAVFAIAGDEEVLGVVVFVGLLVEEGEENEVKSSNSSISDVALLFVSKEGEGVANEPNSSPKEDGETDDRFGEDIDGCEEDMDRGEDRDDGESTEGEAMDEMAKFGEGVGVVVMGLVLVVVVVVVGVAAAKPVKSSNPIEELSFIVLLLFVVVAGVVIVLEFFEVAVLDMDRDCCCCCGIWDLDGIGITEGASGSFASDVSF